MAESVAPAAAIIGVVGLSRLVFTALLGTIPSLNDRSAWHGPFLLHRWCNALQPHRFLMGCFPGSRRAFVSIT